MILFLVAKYISLAITSARALLLAALLGPISYGTLGTLVLTQQYLSYVALGARDGLTVKLAQAHGDTQRVLLICSSTLFWAWCVGTMILAGSILLVLVSNPSNLNWIWVGVISYLSIINEILANIYRDKNRLLKVAVNEIVFNAPPLVAALIFMHSVTVRVVLIAIAGGLLLSILLYVTDTRNYDWSKIKLPIIRQVLFSGIQLAIMSFVTTSLTSVFIFASNVLKLEKTVGLLVFANSVCTIVLYGLNMMAWAATSNSMKGMHKIGSPDGTDRGTSLRGIFRLGVVLCVSSLLTLKFAFLFVLRPYAGSENFAVYMCLMQSYSLLLYKEWNFLAVTSRSLWIAAAYGVVLSAIVFVSFVFPKVSILALMQIALVLLWALSLGCVYFCRKSGFRDANPSTQVCYLCFPVLFGVVLPTIGIAAATTLASAYCLFWLRTDGRLLLARNVGTAA